MMSSSSRLGMGFNAPGCFFWKSDCDSDSTVIVPDFPSMDRIFSSGKIRYNEEKNRFLVDNIRCKIPISHLCKQLRGGMLAYS